MVGMRLGFAIPVPNVYPVVPGFGDEFPGKSRDPGIYYKKIKKCKNVLLPRLLGSVRYSEPYKK